MGSAINLTWAVADAIGVLLAGIIITSFGLVLAAVISGIITLLTGFVYLFTLKE
jgi:ketol-acid reductoisomerase